MEIQDGAQAYKSAGKGVIETVSGKLFDIAAPTFDINDIAHGLSQIVRWNGQCRRFYSVAEHSVMVSMMVEKYGLADPMEGLLHDGTEAYLSDVPSPIKQFLPDWQRSTPPSRSHFGNTSVSPRRRLRGARKPTGSRSTSKPSRSSRVEATARNGRTWVDTARRRGPSVVSGELRASLPTKRVTSSCRATTGCAFVASPEEFP